MRPLVANRMWSPEADQAKRDAFVASRSLHPDLAATVGFIGLAVYSVLVAMGRAEFLPYHSMVEFFVAAVSLSAFFISWHTRKMVEDDFMTFAGITQLYVGLLTVFHLLGYNGMGVLWPWNPNAGLGSQFWIVLRGVMAVGLVAAPFFIGRSTKRLIIALVALGLPVGIAVYSILSGTFPATNVPGVGQTPFKIASEAIIVTLLVLALSLLRRRADELPRRASRDLQASIVLMIAAELLFMAYKGPFDIVSVLGHLTHVAATYFLYHALVVRRLEDPFSTLFRRLHRSERTSRAVVENVHDGVTLLDLTFGRYALINPRMAELSGFSVDELHGLSSEQVLERVHPEDREAAGRLLGLARETGQPQSIDYRWKVKSGEYRWLRHHVDVARDSDGREIGAVSTVQDVTDEMRAEHHRRLLAQVSDDFATYSSPTRLQTAVANRLATYLEAEVAYFLDIDEANDRAILGGSRPAEGPLPPGVQIALSSVVTPAFRVAAAAGETVVINHAEGDPRVSDRALDEFNLGAAICVPLLRDDEWRFLFAVAEAEPREWRPDEIELTQEVGNRLYWRVQRALTEIGLRESEARQAFLLQLADGLSGRETRDIAAYSTRLLGEYVHGSHAFYSEPKDGEIVIRDDYACDTQIRAAGCYKLADLPELVAQLRAGQAVVVSDLDRESRLGDGERDLLMGLGIHSFACAPILHDGQLSAMMMVSDVEAREWSGFEVGLVQEAAERTWSALNATRAQEDLRESLERTQLLQEMAASAASSLDTAELSHRALDIACHRLGADVGAVYVMQAENGIARLAARHGDDAAEVYSPTVAIDEDTPAAKALRSAEIQLAGENPVDEADRGAEGPKARRVACVPLIIRREVIGLIALGFPGHRSFKKQEVELYGSVADQLSVGLENARLYEVEHGIAETLQETLVVLPTHVPGIHFSRAYESATYQSGRVGGDFIDVFEVRGNIVGMTLGDVSGKGIDAAVTTSLVRNTIRVHAADGLPPAQVAIKANLLIRRFTEVESFVTLWFGLLNTKTGHLRYISAGHPPALVITPDGEIVPLCSSDPILGVLDDAKYFERQTVLSAGDRLLLYSDGVTEARSPDGTFLGEDGLHALIQHRMNVSTSSLSDALMDDVISLSAGVLRDDAALLVVEPSRLATSTKDAGQLQAFSLD